MDITELLAEYRGTVKNYARAKGSAWYSIRNSRSGPAQVLIYDEIGTMGISAQDFLAELGQIKGDVELHLNSGGGLVFEGLAIYNALRQRPGTVGVVVDGLAASIASVIAMAASPGELAVNPSSALMIHEGHGVAFGDQAEMIKMAGLLSKASDNIAGIYAERTGQPAAYWREQMKTESWYYGQEAIDAGLADRLTGRDGIGNFLPVTNASADESTWDGGAAMSAAADSGNPASAYRAICAGRRAGDPSKQSSWALPHHKHPGDAPNRAGVSNAMARFPQTQGLENEAAARSHLEAHQRAMGSSSSSGQADLGWLINAFKEA